MHPDTLHLDLLTPYCEVIEESIAPAVLQYILSHFSLFCEWIDAIEVSVHQQSVHGLWRPAAGLQSAEGDLKELTVLEEEVISSIDEGGEELLRSITVESVVREIDQILHSDEPHADIADKGRIVG